MSGQHDQTTCSLRHADLARLGSRHDNWVKLKKAALEEETSTTAILDRLVERHCPSSSKWDRCAVRLSECFAHHFHVTRRAVDNANGVSRACFS